MSKKITKNYVKGSSIALEFNVSKIRALTDKEAEDRAKHRKSIGSDSIDRREIKRPTGRFIFI
ncbi:MAG: hypothetical protein V4732_23095 [Pseudomonadota bacterium]